ncbi:MAG: hypothetical protein KKF78_11005 [Candidatus Omnitrophica bacterium]|nr:hypothetical protein [Candidatus Omnitrophota bacterium]MBU1997663.1 hypothetical protein [Candidatus Omnitrophota bacterium]
MKMCAQIFKKDLSKLKWLIGVWILLALFYFLNNASYFLDNYKMQIQLADINSFIASLQFLMIIVIVPIVIHVDALVGNSAFWLTRPISRKELLISKMSFIFVFLVLIPLFAELAVFIDNGVGVKLILLAIPQILYEKLYFIIPVLLLASLTRKFSKFALIGIIIMVSLFLFGLVESFFSYLWDIHITEFLSNKTLIKSEPYNASLEWSISFIKMVFSFVICIWIILNQFLARNSKKTIKLIVFGFILVILINKFWCWDILNIKSLKPKLLNMSESIAIEPQRESVSVSEGQDYNFYKKKQELKYKNVYLIQDIKGLPQAHIAVLDKFKNVSMEYEDGKVLTWHEDISGYGYGSIYEHDSIEALRSVLKNTKIVNPYNKSTSTEILFKIREEDYDKYRDNKGKYSADGRFNVSEYRITSVIPLVEETKLWVGTEQIVIHDIVENTLGVKIVIGEKKVDLKLNTGTQRDINQFQFYSYNGSSQAFYVLRNKVTGEAFFPDNIDDAQISSPQYNQSILRSRVKQFFYKHKSDQYFSLPEINKEWLKDAELVRIDEYNVGYFNKKVTYEQIALNEKKDYIEKDGFRIYSYDTGEKHWECPDAKSNMGTTCVDYCNKQTFCKEYYKSGSLKLEGFYHESTDNSTVKEYYENGILLYEYTYVDGELDGVVKKYDRNGRLLPEKIYKKGKLVE